MMTSGFTMILGFMALLMGCAVVAEQPLYTNCTGLANATGCSNNTATTSPTTSSLYTIYTTAPNSSIPSLSIWLYNLTAYVDKKTQQAYYNFEFVIDPDTNAMFCNASVSAPEGTLNGIPRAECWQNHAWILQHNYTAPAHFSFAWRNTDQNSTVLVLRSTNPANANHCPDFPHDACWAQGVYWVDPATLLWYDGIQVYAGNSIVRLNGTYCKSGMLECAWSEYIY